MKNILWRMRLAVCRWLLGGEKASDQCVVSSDQKEKGNRSYGSNRSYSAPVKMTPAEWAERTLAEQGDRPVTAVMYGGALDGHECEGVMVNSAVLLIMKDFSTGISYAYERMDLWSDGKAMYRFSMVVGKRVGS